MAVCAALITSAAAEPANTNTDNAIADAVTDEAELDALTPSDATTYCPNFETLDVAARETFWRNLLVQIAERESDGVATRTRWRPYDSAMHRPTFRRGLFQISTEAAESQRYQCAESSAAALSEPAANAACAAKILVRSIEATGAIQGAGAYWPTIAHRRSRAQLAAQLSTSSPCTQGK
ncbi:MAG: transglycosylase SLT domain-containing protein [Terricaulis sp.]